MSEANPFPDFERPPIVETALGVQFDSLERWGLLHFGLFWQSIRSEYQKYSVWNPLPEQVESLDATLPAKVRVDLLTQPEIRCWFLHTDPQWLLQLQKDRLVFNWRRVPIEREYPRYDAIRPRFESDLSRFIDFLTLERIGYPAFNQCEVTYVNQVLPGSGWNSIADVADIIHSWTSSRPGGFLPSPDNLSLHVSYPIENNSGRLHIELKPVVRESDFKLALQLTLTARGAPRSSTQEHVLEWLDVGHKWVVNGFADFTSDKMQQIWGRIQ